MCSSPKPDRRVQRQMEQEAAEARAREEARQASLRAGQQKIDDAFAGFDDNYFDQFLREHKDFHRPMLDRQFADAKDQTAFALARAGTLNSSIAGRQQADLQRDYDEALARILSDGLAQMNQHRAAVQNERNNLVSLLHGTGDAARIGNEATARTQMLFATQPQINPLGGLFSGAGAGIGQYLQNRQNQRVLDAFRRAAGGPSARIVT